MKSDLQVRIIFLLFRLWFGYTMMSNGKFIFDRSQTDFFLQWFGKDLHFPAPLLMYYLAKGSEFFGGLLIFLGLFSRVAAAFVAFTMLVATFTANIHHVYSGDGAITISLFLFALIIVITGSGRLSMDYLIFKGKYQSGYPLDNYLFLLRVWFASLLIYHAFSIPARDTIYIMFNWLFGSGYLAKGIGLICAVSMLAGLFTRISGGVTGVIMLLALVLHGIFGVIDLGGGNLALTRYLFWFSIIIIFYGAGKWNLARLFYK